MSREIMLAGLAMANALQALIATSTTDLKSKTTTPPNREDTPVRRSPSTSTTRWIEGTCLCFPQGFHQRPSSSGEACRFIPYPSTTTIAGVNVGFGWLTEREAFAIWYVHGHRGGRMPYNMRKEWAEKCPGHVGRRMGEENGRWRGFMAEVEGGCEMEEWGGDGEEEVEEEEELRMWKGSPGEKVTEEWVELLEVERVGEGCEAGWVGLDDEEAERERRWEQSERELAEFVGHGWEEVRLRKS